MNNIILCGFMGCGKSTVGKNIARKSGRRFIDMDAYIEEEAGMTVSEIFAREGEEGFRDREHQACLELAQKSNAVIAAGGGALTRRGRFCSVPTRTRRCQSSITAVFRSIRRRRTPSSRAKARR